MYMSFESEQHTGLGEGRDHGLFPGPDSSHPTHPSESQSSASVKMGVG